MIDGFGDKICHLVACFVLKIFKIYKWFVSNVTNALFSSGMRVSDCLRLDIFTSKNRRSIL